MQQLIYIEHSDKTEAAKLSENFAIESIKNRSYINALGAELAMKYLAQENVSISNIANLHNIRKIREEFDIADVMLSNIHIDVRMVYDENVIFIPKSHFEYNLLADIYLVFKMAEDSSYVEFLGFFDPKLINKNNANKDYYFIEKEKLSHPSDLKSYIENFNGNTTEALNEETVIEAQRLALSMIDDDLDNKDKKELINLLLKSASLRDSVIEFDNFEWVSYHTASKGKLFDEPVKQPDEDNIETDNIDDIDDIGEVDEFDVFDNDDEFSSAFAEPDIIAPLVEVSEDDNNEIIDDEITGDKLLNDEVTGEDFTEDEVQEELLEQEVPDLLDEPSEESVEDLTQESELLNQDIVEEETAEDLDLTQVEEPDLFEETELNDDLLSEDILEEDAISLEESDILPEEHFEEDIDNNIIEEDSIGEDITNEESQDNLENDGITEDVLPAQDLGDELDENLLDDEELLMEDMELQDLELEEQIDNIGDIESDDENTEFSGIQLPPSNDTEETPEISEKHPTDETTETLISIDSLITEDAPTTENQEIDTPKEENETLESLDILFSEEQEKTENDESDDENITENFDNDEAEENLESNEEIEDEDNSDFDEPAKETAEETETSDETADDEDLPISFENSTTITNDDENYTAGEIAIDINYADENEIFSDEYLEESTENSTESENESVELAEFINSSDVSNENPNTFAAKISANENGKKAIVIATTVVTAFVSLLVYAMMNRPSNNIEETQDNTLNEKVATAPTTQPEDLEQQVLEVTPKKQPKIEDTVKKVEEQTATEVVKQTPIESAYIDVKKLGWSIPDYLSYNEAFRKYLQTSGKSLKLTLSSDLLLATEYAYTNEIQVSVVLNKDGSLKDTTMLKTSGSTQIDNIVLRTVKDTLNVIKAPADVIVGDKAQLVLKIYL